MENVEQKLKEIICDYVDIPSENIKGDTSLKCDMGLDSFGLISLVCNIEDTFKVKIPDTELANFETINDMVSYIQNSNR